jgi:hypothetical protein
LKVPIAEAELKAVFDLEADAAHAGEGRPPWLPSNDSDVRHESNSKPLGIIR